jgi:tRNA modification GTPase
LVANKSDKVTEVSFNVLPVYCHKHFYAMVAVSAMQRTNLEKLEDAIERSTQSGGGVGEGKAWAVNDRQAEALVRAHESVTRVKKSVDEKLPLDFWTIDLRDTLHALGSVSGDTATEEILDVVFSKFCIGK